MRTETKEKNEYGLRQVEVRLNLREAGTLYSSTPMNGPEAAAEVMKNMLKELDRESLCIVNLDTRNRPINFNVCAVGSLTEAQVTMSNVFKSAILSNAAGIMLMHNHPSGVVMPSWDDDEITRKAIQAGNLMNIGLVDHLIVGGVNGDVYSYLREKPWIWREAQEGYLFEETGRYIGENKERYNMEFRDFEAFSEFFTDTVKNNLPAEYADAKVTVSEVTRSDRVYNALTVTKNGENASPAIDLNRLYDQYKKGTPVADLAAQAVKLITSVRMAFSFSPEDLKDYDKVKDRLFVRLHGREKNAAVRERAPHTDIGDDFFLTYHVMIQQGEDSVFSSLITDSLRELIPVSDEQLRNDALINTMKMMPPVFQLIGSHMEEITPEGFSVDVPSPDDLFVLTNDSGINGSAVFFYPGVQEMISERMGGDYFILPSSIHELLIMPVKPGRDYRELEYMVRDVNRRTVEDEDQLSDRVFCYDHNLKQVRRASEMFRTQDNFIHEETQTYTAGPSAKERREMFRKQAAEQFISLLQPDNPVKSFEWVQEWKDAARPESFRSGEPYRGINNAVLTMAALANGYTDPRWTTLNFLKYKKGMGVRKGEKGVMIEYWLAKDLTKQPGEHNRIITTKEAVNMIRNGQRKQEDFTLVPRYSRVFNAEQCYGIPKLEETEKKQISQSEMVTKISKRMQVPIINEKVSNGCYYSPGRDEVYLPDPSNFTTEYAYNAAALHELAHASGASNRLDRNIKNVFGSEDYAFEELVAEMTSCFTSAQLTDESEEGKEEYRKHNTENHYRYVKGWAESIRNDPDCLVKALKLAEQSADYLDLNAGIITTEEFNLKHGRTKRATIDSKDHIQITPVNRSFPATQTLPTPSLSAAHTNTHTYNQSAKHNHHHL